jgi:uncharacterized OB-fold protein
MGRQVPLVDYLVLKGEPHLVANECTDCGARFFDRRNACASCGQTKFSSVGIATEGVLRTFTIVAHAAAGIPVPFVAGVVDCDGTSVRANVINIPPDPEHVHTGMKLRLATYVVGTDDEGTEAIGFGFEPAEPAEPAAPAAPAEPAAPAAPAEPVGTTPAAPAAKKAEQVEGD